MKVFKEQIPAWLMPARLETRRAAHVGLESKGKLYNFNTERKAASPEARVISGNSYSRWEH